MSRSSFLDSIRVDQATIDRCNEASKQASQNAENSSGKKSGVDDGGYERGDTGPASQGREPGFKWGEAPDLQSNSTETQNMSSQSSDASAASSMGDGAEGSSVGSTEGGTSVGGESGASGGCEGGNGYGCGM